MKYQIILDDVCYDLEISNSIEEETIKCIGSFEYYNVVQCILSKKQYNDYLCDTVREFEVTEKKIQKVREYLKTSIWRKQLNKTK